jgi:16S rRNA (guanine(1405)-N(7))-methyltransferase
MQDNVIVEQIVESVLASPKYQAINPALVRRLASSEGLRFHNTKKAIKATKNKLHQVTGAYLNSQPDWGTWLKLLQNTADSPNQVEFNETCKQVMRLHASTLERLPILDTFYRETLSGLCPIHSILDIACGLNPLAIPWMPISHPLDYYAIDIYQDMIDFLNEAFPLFNVRGLAQSYDMVEFQPDQPVDLALVLKTIPCLEQIDKNAGSTLLERLPARHMLVSFPARSLGGRNKGMMVNYEDHFHTLLAGKSWKVLRFVFPSELAFLITKEEL